MNGKTFAERVGLLGVGDVAVGSIFTEFEIFEIRGAGPRRGQPPGGIYMQLSPGRLDTFAPEHHRPLTLDAWPTLPGRLFDDELQSRPSASFHPRGRASRRPSKSGRLAAVHQSPCMLSSPRCPSQRMRGPLRVQKSAFAALLLSQTTTSACVGGNDLCRQSEFPRAATTFGATHTASLPHNALHKPSL